MQARKALNQRRVEHLKSVDVEQDHIEQTKKSVKMYRQSHIHSCVVPWDGSLIGLKNISGHDMDAIAE